MVQNTQFWRHQHKKGEKKTTCSYHLRCGRSYRPVQNCQVRFCLLALFLLELLYFCLHFYTSVFVSAPFGLYITCRNLSHHQRQVDLKNLQRKIAGTRTHCVDPDDLKRSSNIPLHPASIPKPLTLNRFHKLARSATRPNGQLLADFIAWVKLKPHFCVFGAPFQADAQMINLCRKYKRWIRGVMRSARVCVSVCKHSTHSHTKISHSHSQWWQWCVAHGRPGMAFR